MQYGLKEFKELIEKRLTDAGDPINLPFGVDPNSAYGVLVMRLRREIYTDVLEQFPEIA